MALRVGISDHTPFQIFNHKKCLNWPTKLDLKPGSLFITPCLTRSCFVRPTANLMKSSMVQTIVKRIHVNIGNLWFHPYPNRYIDYENWY